MKTRTHTLVIFTALLCLLGLQHAQAEKIQTRIGELEFTHDFANGYPTDKTVEKLFDEIDFQRACQAYIWAIPIVSMAKWQYEHNEALGAENGQIVYIESYDDRAGGLTYNATTPQILR